MVNLFLICRRWEVRATALNRAQVSRCLRKLMLLRIQLTLEGTEGRSACPSGWSKYRSHCFRYISTERTWAEFEQFFVYQGDNLASVHSLWLCSDGSRFDFTNWSKGQPDIYEGKQNCLYFNYGAEKRWDDGICSTKLSCTHKLTRTHIKQNK
uniref:C-type lectin domain-containing protein n=1 Tax=Salmo trutta TaxID=8032 RepID=A0A674A0W1_SALTR